MWETEKNRSMKGKGKRCRVRAGSFRGGSMSVVPMWMNSWKVAWPSCADLCSLHFSNVPSWPTGTFSFKVCGLRYLPSYSHQVTHLGDQIESSHSQPSHGSGLSKSKATSVGNICFQPLRVGYLSLCHSFPAPQLWPPELLHVSVWSL